MTLALSAAEAGDDGGRKTGCVIVHGVSSGPYNGFTMGWNGIQVADGIKPHAARRERPEKYFWAEHAERMAIQEAARKGFALEGATIYVTWFPCMDCARMIVGCRMKQLVYGREPDLSDPRYGEDFKRVKTLLNEGRVAFRCLPVEEENEDV